ncbi:S1 family peptidase [Streptomyces sp. AV19]|uniref:S1 family peptidase n=1 Tax=Streptomyces sp. AV19 TaxID=2793068 RepID=UPI0018FE6125|nr:S1 family peptidase [Streptomyces sp. AV19]MBH1936579.1 S1 family peptidase [Streptomyces sp. AV19]MDG4532639.1 S1 family peptidase [Streptomyces sp. AV19]
MPAAVVLAASALVPQPADASASTAARLAATRQTLDARAAIPGTAWVTDPRAGRVVVTADSTVTGARLARLTEVTAGLGDAVVVRRTTARLTRFVAGGGAVWGGTARCSLGFNVNRGGRPAFLTAGHCGNAVPDWAETRGGPRAAVTETSVFPGGDYALARYTDGAARPSAVDLHDGGTRTITRAGRAYAGERVRRSGATTGVRGGTVTGLNATVNYQEGRVDGLIETDVCAEPGDSGGPLFDGDAALGITSGGTGNCRTGGKTYYQPVDRALRALGASIG